MESVKNSVVNGLYCLVDWLEFTIDGLNLDVPKPCIDSNKRGEVNHWLSFLGLQADMFDDLDKGGYGYKSSCKHMYDNIWCYYDGADDMGIHIRCSGSSVGSLLFQVKASYMVNDLPSDFGRGSRAYDVGDNDIEDILYMFIEKVRSIGHFTRIDLAIDDIGCKYYTVAKLGKLVSNGNVVSKMKKCQEIKDKSLTAKLFGHTVYFGSRQSDVYIRVYDKRAEQELDIPWTRWELEIKHDKADEVAKMLVDSRDLGHITFGVLSNYIRIVRLEHSRRTNCPLDDTWQAFVYGCEKVPIRILKIDKTIADKQRWIEHQCMPTLAGLIVANGGDISFIRDKLELHFDRLSGKDKKMYQAELERSEKVEKH